MTKNGKVTAGSVWGWGLELRFTKATQEEERSWACGDSSVGQQWPYQLLLFLVPEAKAF